MTSWETFSPEPNWKAVNTSASSVGSKDGWHVLVLQVAHGSMTYFVDGIPLASHGGRFYPEVPMSINYNLWFIRDGLQAARETTYVQTYALALVQARLGEPDSAFALLEESFRDRSEDVTMLSIDPRADPLRSDPRFVALMRRVGLP